MDDRLKRQLAGAGEYGAAQGDRPVLGQLTEWSVPAAPLDRAGDALRDQQPSRNHVAVPGVDDDVNILIQQVAVNQLRHHGGEPSCRGSGRIDAPAAATPRHHQRGPQVASE